MFFFIIVAVVMVILQSKGKTNILTKNAVISTIGPFSESMEAIFIQTITLYERNKF